MNSLLDNLNVSTIVVPVNQTRATVPQNIIKQPINNCLVDSPLGNSNCHSHGVINYNTTLPCNRCSFTPLYVREICTNRSQGCNVSYKKCVQKLTCNNNSCNYC